jgi:hypothetical protein
MGLVTSSVKPIAADTFLNSSFKINTPNLILVLSYEMKLKKYIGEIIESLHDHF